MHVAKRQTHNFCCLKDVCVLPLFTLINLRLQQVQILSLLGNTKMTLIHRPGCPGCASGEIFLWEYGAKQAMAGYTPLPATAGAAPPLASGSIFSAPKSIWAIDRPGALAALGNWGQPQSVSLLVTSLMESSGEGHPDILSMFIVPSETYGPQPEGNGGPVSLSWWAQLLSSAGKWVLLLSRSGTVSHGLMQILSAVQHFA